MNEKLKRAPHYVPHTSQNVRGAWWYENPKSIDVYVEPSDTGTTHVRLTRRAILAWLKRTENYQ